MTIATDWGGSAVIRMTLGGTVKIRIAITPPITASRLVKMPINPHRGPRLPKCAPVDPVSNGLAEESGTIGKGPEGGLTPAEVNVTVCSEPVV